MKFIISSSNLLKELSSISGIISNNPVLPILDSFLFNLENGNLTITASDLQTSMVTSLPVSSEVKMKLAVPGKILLDTLKNLPKQPLTFFINKDTYTLEITSNNGRYKLSGENATDFPLTPDFDENSTKIKISAKVLQKAIDQSIFATSNNDLKPAMCGIYVMLNGEGITFVTTDSNKLVKYLRTDIVSDKALSIIIPKKPMNILANILNDKEEDVIITLNDSDIAFEIGNLKVKTKLINERYPAYENVIPKDNPYKLILDRMILLSSLKRLSAYSNKTTQKIRLIINSTELNMIAEDFEFSNEAVEKIACDYHGENMEIGFNVKFFIETINNIDSDKIEIHLLNPSKAAVIIPAEKKANEHLIMLIMPLMVNS
jgi:DNA polymerase-3 subunit beta